MPTVAQVTNANKVAVQQFPQGRVVSAFGLLNDGKTVQTSVGNIANATGFFTQIPPNATAVVLQYIDGRLYATSWTIL